MLLCVRLRLDLIAACVERHSLSWRSNLSKAEALDMVTCLLGSLERCALRNATAMK